MDFKKEFNRLVKEIKLRSAENGRKIKNDEIARRLGFSSRTYLSDLMGNSSNKEVGEKHILLLKEKFKDELEGIVIKPSSPGDELNRERAMIRVLMQRVAKLESERLGIPVEVVLKEIEQDTMIAWKDLEK